jgi:hypothetical protein
MNENAGAACALSVLIVGIFAILLRDKVPTLPAHPPTPSVASSRATTSPGILASPPALPQPVPSPAVAQKAPSPQVRRVSVTVRPAEVAVAVIPARPVPPPARAVPKPAKRPSASFTQVEVGETLADVAARVYGSADAADELWRSNRDQLPRPDSPVRVGMLLRTP